MVGDRNCGEISASTLRKNRPDPVEANIIQKAADSNTRKFAIRVRVSSPIAFCLPLHQPLTPPWRPRGRAALTPRGGTRFIMRVIENP